MSIRGDDADFMAGFDDMLQRRGWSGERRSIWGFVESYEDLVAQCERGYTWTIYELENELSVRDALADALHDEQLATYSQLDQVRDRVTQLDRRLRAVFMDDVLVGPEEQPWWRRGVLKVGGTEYVEDVRRISGLEGTDTAS